MFYLGTVYLGNVATNECHFHNAARFATWPFCLYRPVISRSPMICYRFMQRFLFSHTDLIWLCEMSRLCNRVNGIRDARLQVTTSAHKAMWIITNPVDSHLQLGILCLCNASRSAEEPRRRHDIKTQHACLARAVYDHRICNNNNNNNNNKIIYTGSYTISL